MGFFDTLFGKNKIKAREPQFAGDIYPADPGELAGRVRGLLEQAESEPDADVRAILAPHAAYGIAGQVMAEAYRAASGRAQAIRRVVVVGSSRLVPFRGLALDAWEGFETPMGVLEYPRDGFWDGAPDDVTFRRMAAAFDPEESIEAQLPFVQELVADVECVPVLVGDASPEDVLAALRWLVDGETLLVVSANLSHDATVERTSELDAQTEAAICGGDSEVIGREHTTGRTAVRAAMKFAQQKGWAPRCLARSNSHEQGGGTESVVGYGAFVWSS